MSDDVRYYKWMLFRAMVCDEIERQGLADLIGCDPWTYSEALDASFDEISDRRLSEWRKEIEKDAAEMKKDIVKVN